VTRRERKLLAEVENSAFAWQLREFVREKGRYEGLATWILTNLNERATEAQRAAKGWPKAPNRAGQLISKFAPVLRLKGVKVSYNRHGLYGRLWLLEGENVPLLPIISRTRINTPDALIKRIHTTNHAVTP
jgi:hypothetical protein